MMGGLASSRVLELFGSRMVARDFVGGIPTRLYQKDLQIGLEFAHTLRVAVPAAAVTMQYLNELMGRGREDDDLSALVTIVEDLCSSH
jgi:2-hydroxy-3-oxopropionate reductase